MPTGIKIFNWIGTMWGGRLRFPVPMLWCIGVIYVFTIGGITGVMLASPPIDYGAQDTYFVVAHMHNVLIGGSVFAGFAGIYFWFPKLTGRMLSEALGRVHVLLWVVGFALTFVPQYILGAEGMPRRIVDYPDDRGWAELNLVSTIGALLLAAGMVPFLAAVVLALRRPADAPADPWGGNSLEWATSSPPPHHNFDSLPPIRSAATRVRRRVAAPPPRRPRRTRQPFEDAILMADEVKLFGRLSLYALVVGTIYWFVSYEFVGTVMLLGFGLATGLAFIILFRRDRKVRAARAADGPD